MRSPRCDTCNKRVRVELLHQQHTVDCLRWCDGWCRCDGPQVCADCCTDCTHSPEPASPTVLDVRLAAAAERAYWGDR